MSLLLSCLVWEAAEALRDSACSIEENSLLEPPDSESILAYIMRIFDRSTQAQYQMEEKPGLLPTREEILERQRSGRGRSASLQKIASIGRDRSLSLRQNGSWVKKDKLPKPPKLT